MSVSLQNDPGASIAIAGALPYGKFPLINALPRLFPDDEFTHSFSILLSKYIVENPTSTSSGISSVITSGVATTGFVSEAQQSNMM